MKLILSFLIGTSLAIYKGDGKCGSFQSCSGGVFSSQEDGCCSPADFCGKYKDKTDYCDNLPVNAEFAVGTNCTNSAGNVTVVCDPFVYPPTTAGPTTSATTPASKTTTVTTITTTIAPGNTTVINNNTTVNNNSTVDNNSTTPMTTLNTTLSTTLSTTLNTTTVKPDTTQKPVTTTTKKPVVTTTNAAKPLVTSGIIIALTSLFH